MNVYLHWRDGRLTRVKAGNSEWPAEGARLEMRTAGGKRLYFYFEGAVTSDEGGERCPIFRERPETAEVSG